MTTLVLSALAISFCSFATAQSGTAASPTAPTPTPQFTSYPSPQLSSGAVIAIVISSLAFVTLIVLASIYSGCCCRNRASSLRSKQGDPAAAQIKDLERQVQDLYAQVAMLQSERNVEHADLMAAKMEKERMSNVGVNRDRNSGRSYTGDEDARSAATKSYPPGYDASV
ncbi:hypothetical protein C8J57DRAFT_1299649 [Mycena rebaudengoi]|nr:hypothetical protein C8J57DRAFT_1335092 [Mycena rebaudengoi]KAJ7280584.1 hypothetical protein C8J57DRAFT_1299649 [Mycena rebaudengoi]